MLIGYARVSTQDQNLELQTEALIKIGCTKVFKDKISGSRAERPGLGQGPRSPSQGRHPRRLEAGSARPKREELSRSRRRSS
jgi:Resolvase, N terminal domain